MNMTSLFAFRFLCFITFCMALVGCSMSDDYAAAEIEVPGFHVMFNDRKFDEIYEAAGMDLKEAVSKKDFTAFLAGAHGKLGVTMSSKLLNKSVNYHTSGTFVTLVYSTQYEKGEATEQFKYKLDGEQASLYGYHVNSNVFVIQ